MSPEELQNIQRQQAAQQQQSANVISPEQSDWLSLSATQRMLDKLQQRYIVKLECAGERSRDVKLDDKFIRILINEANTIRDTIRFLKGELQ